MTDTPHATDRWVEQKLERNTTSYVIAEVAQTHDGSLGCAHAFIDAAAQNGADAIKFQTHIAEAETTAQEPWRVKFSQQDASRYDYWKRMEFTPEQWAGLKHHADECGIDFLSSPFSIEAIELLSKIGVKAWKVASGEALTSNMLDAMAATGKPFLLSTGMSRIEEIDDAVDVFRKNGNAFAVFQCTSMYPTPPDRIGLNMIPLFRDRYDCPVGLSDHSGSIAPCIGAAALGARLFEVHVTFDRGMFGPDVSVSLTFRELATLVDSIRLITAVSAAPVDKDEVAAELDGMRKIFGKSIVAARDLGANTFLTKSDIALKKPGNGIPANQVDTIIGKTLLSDLSKDEQISPEHLV
jgi:N,N'-diacetyllegionaminate synthase